MWWFKRHPELLQRECEGLGSDSNYKQVSLSRKNRLASSGMILVRLRETKKYPILIVYPEATPYELPKVFLLNRCLEQNELDTLAERSEEAGYYDLLKSNIKLEYRRHQNSDGSLCLLESDNLEGIGAWFFGINQVLARIRNWLAGISTGNLPLEGPEIELYAHFPNRSKKASILVTEAYLGDNLNQGDFYAYTFNKLISFDGKERSTVYAGVYLDGQSKSGIFLAQESFKFQLDLILDGIEKPSDFHSPDYQPKIQNLIREEKLLKGYWWNVNELNEPFENTNGLSRIIGNGDIDIGHERLFQISEEGFRKAEPDIYFGLRYPLQGDRIEWQFFHLERKTKAKSVALLDKINLQEFINRLEDYDTKVICSELYTDEKFHLRNSKRAIRTKLKTQSINIVGCGSLGSEVADSLTKAGIGKLHLIDKDGMKISNSVRHVCGSDYVGISKSLALTDHLRRISRFIKLTNDHTDILKHGLAEKIDGQSFSISTIADDNVEGYLNEQAVIHDQIVFYARALRGGKAARIFRVIPGKDACFHCLTLHKQDNHFLFIDVPDDDQLPTLTNECNNPIRPGSAADLKLIAAITSRILIDSLQDGFGEHNHWIWSNEELPNVEGNKLQSIYLKPHPKCQYCSNEHPIEVSIQNSVLNFMRAETQKSPKIETGGILLGVNDKNGKLNILFASDCGPNAKKTPTRFEKDIVYCQKFLDDHASKYGDQAMYLGEWHYHPMADNRPSNIDLDSLSGISLQKEYLTDRPVMIILNNEGHARTTVHPAGSRYYEVNLKSF